MYLNVAYGRVGLFNVIELTYYIYITSGRIGNC